MHCLGIGWVLQKIEIKSPLVNLIIAIFILDEVPGISLNCEFIFQFFLHKGTHKKPWKENKNLYEDIVYIGFADRLSELVVLISAERNPTLENSHLDSQY